MRFFLEISFAGTNYSGWQIQKNAHSVQAEINKALSSLLSNQIKTTGCGRTDAGVHAKQFFLHFDTDRKPPDDFIYKLNRLLPDDIAAHRLIPVEPHARSRQDATERTYQYHVHLKKDPFLKDFSFYFPFGNPDIHKMQEAARLLKAFRDFKPLSKTDTVEKTTLCNIYFSEWKRIDENRLCYTVTADHFLRGMVRLMVGAMLMIGTDKMSLGEFSSVMKKKERFRYVMAVPGCGLSLVSVRFPYL
ncbi:MAG TPA: tRNA pseudouridine(38-40) synthase TruA [Chitinophagales bacterium]|nr:tRNA pseudouridine(38-40) synthase TruA [Chitinophagales bacterium]